MARTGWYRWLASCMGLTPSRCAKRARPTTTRSSSAPRCRTRSSIISATPVRSANARSRPRRRSGGRWSSKAFEDIVERSEAFELAMAASRYRQMVAGRWRRGRHQYGSRPRDLPKGDDKASVPTTPSGSSNSRCCLNGKQPHLYDTLRRRARRSGNPAFSTEAGSEFYKEANEVYEAVKNTTPEKTVVARFWSDDPMLSMTPPGHWVSIALVGGRARQPVARRDTVDLLARMGVAMSDAFVGCWHAKFTYDLVRPRSRISRRTSIPSGSRSSSRRRFPNTPAATAPCRACHGRGADGVLRRELCIRGQDRLTGRSQPA